MEEIDLETARASGLLPKLRPKPLFGKPKKKSDPNKPWYGLIADIVLLCRYLKIDPPIRELVFHPVRKWRYDLAWPIQHVAIEREGGTFHHREGTFSAHTTGKGYAKDAEKYNEAALFGWLVLRYPSDQLTKKRRAYVLDQIERALTRRDVWRS